MIPSQKRGTLVEYYLEARAGADLAVRVPSEARAAGFQFYYKGTPSRPLLVTHTVLIFVSLFILLLAAYLAIRVIRGARPGPRIARLGFLGGVFFFVASIPLGMIVAFQTLGRPWTGFPVGTGFADSKSLAIVLYWAASTFLYRGSVFKGDPSSDLLSLRAMPYVYLTGAAITLGLYLIPH
jgi:hypothetical protein